MRPTGPVIVVERNGDIDVFESLDKAERYLEPMDFRNGEYMAAYDDQGRRIQFHVVAAKKKGLLGLWPYAIETTVFHSVDSGPSHAIELRDALVTFLTPFYIEREMLMRAPLADLVSLALKHKTE